MDGQAVDQQPPLIGYWSAVGENVAQSDGKEARKNAVMYFYMELTSEQITATFFQTAFSLIFFLSFFLSL